MFRRAIAIMLAGILSTAFVIQSVGAQTGKDIEAEKARAKVQKLGVGRDAAIEVKLRDNTRLKGYIGATGEDSFTVINSKTSASETVAYADVVQVKKPGGGGLSMRAFAIIGAAVVAAVIVGVTVVKPVACDGGAGC